MTPTDKHKKAADSLWKELADHCTRHYANPNVITITDRGRDIIAQAFADIEAKYAWNYDMSAAPRDGTKVDLWLALNYGGTRQTNCWFCPNDNLWMYSTDDGRHLPVETNSIKATAFRLIDMPEGE